MTKARDLANIISGGFTADDIPNLDASKITTGTLANGRIAEASVTQHVTATDLQPVKSDISALALREATNESSAAFNLPNQFIETFEAGNDVKSILFDTTFISQSTTIATQLSQFQKQDNNLSLVVDEYGEIQGLLTLEDIFTEIVGKFGAAKADLEKEFLIKKDGSVVADGNSKIRELNNFMNWDIDEDGSKTINGVITDYLDQIPQENVCLEINDYRIEVLHIEENSITKVKIKKKGAKPPFN